MVKSETRKSTGPYEDAVVNSSIWAALGDAAGWISELTDAKGIKRRVGAARVTKPVEWKRKVFSRGPVVTLPAGTYSDDTQLRLAVSRATRVNGKFDVEAFAKLELPVWLSYSLGAGLGSTAAAGNLSKSSVSWFSNFFNIKGRDYFKAGGNGAAMRIQPHVWKVGPRISKEFLLDVLKDSITTHGHPHGFCGAVFHAYCVNIALSEGAVPPPSTWRKIVYEFGSIPEALVSDQHLRNVWLPTWEQRSKNTIHEALAQLMEEAIVAIDSIENVVNSKGTNGYQEVLSRLDLKSPSVRGSGMLTAIAASSLSWLFRDAPIEQALLEAVNSLGSDTDTIATMAGAIMGGARPQEVPNWPLQDKNYIEFEARRIANIPTHGSQQNFAYPDLMQWSPPENQSDAVGTTSNGDTAIRGLGRATLSGNEWQQGDFVWQWMKLPFGQSVLAKRRETGMKSIDEVSLPSKTGYRESSPNKNGAKDAPEPGLPFDRPVPMNRIAAANTPSSRPNAPSTSTSSSERGQNSNYPNIKSLDELTNIVIRSNFNPNTIGRAFLEAAQGEQAVEKSIGFASIITKAIVARKRR